MKYNVTPKPFTCKLLIFLHTLLGIGAIFGGGALTINPNGSLLSMPIDILERSPFNNFFIPGILLLIMFGIIPLAIVCGLINKRELEIGTKLNFSKKMHWSWSFSLYIGFALIIWLVVQVYILNAVVIIHLVYFGLGLSIQAVTILPSVQEYYMLKPKNNLNERMG